MADSVKNLGKGALRTAKNYTKGYSDAQVKVREATSNDAWGPSGTQMNEIARMTYDQSDFVEIMEMLDKRLNDKGKNWRHVFKALTVLDYALHGGSENVVLYFKENLYIVKTLKEFQYIDENGKDQGVNVRAKAKDITNLLMDDTRLREERRTRAHMQNRLHGTEEPPSPRMAPPERERRPRRTENDDDLARAIAASKQTAADEAAKTQADKDLEEAIKLSQAEEDEAKRRRDAGSRSLFDDAFNTNGNNNDQLIDLSGPSEGSNLPLQYANYNAYPQPSQAFDQAYQQYLMQQQQQQQWEQQQQQQQYEQQQQQLAFQQQQEALRQQELQRQQALMQQQQMLQYQQTAQPLVPQATSIGSNNPFARFQTSSPAPPLPQMSATPPPQSHSPSVFSSSISSQTPPPPQAPTPTASTNPFPKRAKTMDGQHSELNRLLATGTGIDTFGNEGNARLPAIHTQTRALISQPTGAFPQSGSNPFHQQPARTGSVPPFQPQSQFGQQNGFGGGAANGGSQQMGDTTANSSPFFTI